VTAGCAGVGSLSQVPMLIFVVARTG